MKKTAKQLKEEIISFGEVIPSIWVGFFLTSIEECGYQFYDGITQIEGGYVAFAQRDELNIALGIKFDVDSDYKEKPDNPSQIKEQFKITVRQIAQVEHCVPLLLTITCSIDSMNYLEDFLEVSNVRLEII